MKNRNFDIWLAIGLNILHYRKEKPGKIPFQRVREGKRITGGFERAEVLMGSFTSVFSKRCSSWM